MMPEHFALVVIVTAQVVGIWFSLNYKAERPPTQGWPAEDKEGSR